MNTYLVVKVSFFWDQSHNMSLSGFPPKNQSSDWLTSLVRGLFCGKPLELISWLGSQKKQTLVNKYIVLSSYDCILHYIKYFFFIWCGWSHHNSYQIYSSRILSCEKLMKDFRACVCVCMCVQKVLFCCISSSSS